MKARTYSFCINLGCYFIAIPDQWLERIRSKSGLLRPQEWHCHLRRRLSKTISQPQLEAKDVWYIDPEGYYLESAVHDARVVIETDALLWFARYSDDREILGTLLGETESDDGTWGMGALPSPNRHRMTGYIALANGDRELALKHLHAAAEWYTQISRSWMGSRPEGDVWAWTVRRLSKDIQAIQDG